MKTLFYKTLWITAFFVFASSCGKSQNDCKEPTLGLWDNRITMKSLGTMGRFGNQLFQYMFLKVYAKRHHLQAETPTWIGDRLYGLTDTKMTAPFCQSMSEENRVIDSYSLSSNETYLNVDFVGYYQFHTSHHAADRDYIRSLFYATPEVRAVVQPAVNQLKAMGRTLVTIHIRRGDFGQPPFVTSPTLWYLQWLDQVWPGLDNPVLFIASDEINQVVRDFERYHPITLSKLNVSLPEADYYPEHYIMSHSDILAISNSTFSASAAMLNSTATAFYRPDFNNKRMIQYDPWNSIPWESWHH